MDVPDFVIVGWIVKVAYLDDHNDIYEIDNVYVNESNLPADMRNRNSIEKLIHQWFPEGLIIDMRYTDVSQYFGPKATETNEILRPLPDSPV